MEICKYGTEVVQGLTRFIRCEETKEPCTLQRYCPTEKRCVNVDCYFAICKILDKKREEEHHG